MFCLFLTFTHTDLAVQLSDVEHAALERLIRSVPLVARAHVLTPAVAKDRYYDDGPPPMLALQLYFTRLEQAEAAIASEGTLQGLFGPDFPSLTAAEASHQVMWTRPFPVEASPPEAAGPSCAFMVHYHGEPDDAHAWHRFYLQHHPAIMATFPQIRDIEIYTKVDWIDTLPSRRVEYFQRNKIVFDSAAALETALTSPTRERMKADRKQFPPFSGGSIHVPMHSKTILG
ncbi:EthD family reductase [Novosphingobium terrae]|uniref:EthD family reductase n=1 Tax=Novosphingobium terrae TaxID=2726189 RepID=UPI001981D225|nr:EthD family reductase [Novosphingobium terrae]